MHLRSIPWLFSLGLFGCSPEVTVATTGAHGASSGVTSSGSSGGAGGASPGSTTSTGTGGACPSAAPMACGGTCIPVLAEPGYSYCTTCAFDCPDECDPAQCGPLSVLAKGLTDPRSIALDADSIYWASGTYASPMMDGVILRLAKSGGSPVTLVSGLGTTTSVHVDASHVYWSDGRFARVPKAGGTPEMLADGVGNFQLDDAYAYWCDGANLMKISKAGGPATQLAVSPSGCHVGVDLAVDSGQLFWFGVDGSLNEVSTEGGVVTQLATSPQPYALAVRAPYVYWTNSNPAQLLRVPTAGGPVEPIVPAGAGHNLAVDETSVYWDDLDQIVKKMPLAGGLPTLVATGPELLSSMAVDADRVYWTAELNAPEHDLVLAAPK